MARLIAKFCAVLVFGSLGVASVGAEPRAAAEPSGGEVTAGAEIAQGTAPQATSDATATVPMQSMSDEEKERRRQVCDKIFDYCNSKCKRFYDNPRFRNKLEPCRRQCSEDNAECMKEIR